MEPYQQLEREWAEWNGLDPTGMVVCSSGTAALHLSLEALQLPQGSEVLVPDFTMIACARAATLAGLVPVFVDCDDRLLMDTELFPENPPWPSAIMLVHVYGRRWPMEWFNGLEEDELTTHRTCLIEDLAEAHGVRPSGHTDAACWSFYKNKIIAGEEGGAVWFKDAKRAALARQLRNLGFTDAHDFTHAPRGHNYRLANCLAERVLLCLRRSRYELEQRCLIESWYDSACPPEWQMPHRDAPWVYDFRIKGLGAVDQDRIVRALNEAGIAARHGFKPMSDQKEYLDCRMVAKDRIQGGAARLASREIIYLSIQPGITRRGDAERAFELVGMCAMM